MRSPDPKLKAEPSPSFAKHPPCIPRPPGKQTGDLRTVWEWVEDWHAPFLHIAQTNPLVTRGGENLVSRGGSWFNEEAGSRSGTRNAGSTTFSNPDHGFRLARDP